LKLKVHEHSPQVSKGPGKENGQLHESSAPEMASQTTNTLHKRNEDASATQTTTSRKAMVPMTREEYEKQQSIVREVYDPESGRMRLIRGTGEVIERIVTRDQHASINRRATTGDGVSFARGITAALLKRNEGE
jgi:hypothetical protein